MLNMQERKHYRLWNDLQHNGILHQELVEHVWKGFSSTQQGHLLKILEQFDLICLTSRRRYYVPSMFKRKDTDKHKKNPDETKECTQFFVDFEGSFTGFVIFIFLVINKMSIPIIPPFPVQRAWNSLVYWRISLHGAMYIACLKKL